MLTGLFLGVSEMRGQTDMTGKGLSFSELRKERSASGKELDLRYKVSVPKGAIKSQQVVYVYPILVSKDRKRSINLNSFAFAGKRRALLIKRAERLHNTLPLPKVDTMSGVDQTLVLRSVLPFERWMIDADVQFDEHLFGCAECPSEKMVSIVEFPKLELFTSKDYKYNFYLPAEVSQKRLEDKFESRVTFEVAKSDIKRDFGKNAVELSRLENFVSKSLRHEGTKLDTVEVAGYASPEGRFDFNRMLSDKRANALADYIRIKYPKLGKNVYMRVIGHGEDWAGLAQSLNRAEVPYAQDVINLINDEKDPDTRKNAIKKLQGGEIYKNMLQNFYPQLRKTLFRLSYQVRFFGENELMGVYNKDPRLLSNREFYKLAINYMHEEKDPVEIFETAYKFYPKDIMAALNYANALLKYRKDEFEHVLKILEPFKDDRRCDMPRAIAENELGHYERAEEIIQKH